MEIMNKIINGIAIFINHYLSYLLLYYSDQLLTIGWGSAETQFQGSVGKQSTDKQERHKMAQPIRTNFDNKSVLISWHADGNLFAVNSVDEICMSKQFESPSKNASDKMLCRQIRVWSNKLEFLSQCAFLPGIEAALCIWANYSCNLIAVPTILYDERHICFYERNGQLRNKFKVEEIGKGTEKVEQLDSYTVIRSLAANLEGNVLAVYFEDTSAKSFQLQFWTVSNYCWSEKLRLSVEELIESFWDSQYTFKFCYLTKNGIYNSIIFQLEYNCEDLIALSVNGNRIRVTDLKYAPIPPPMCHYELSLDFVGVPSHFVLSPIYGLAVVGSDCKKISTFTLNDRKLTHNSNIYFEQNVHLLCNLIWHDKNRLLCFQKRTQCRSYELIEFQLDNKIINRINWKSTKVNSLSADHLQLDDEHEFLITLQEVNPLKTSVDSVKGCKLIELEKESLIVHTNSNYQLFINGMELHSEVDNFCCNNQFLIMIASKHRVFCLPINYILKSLRNGNKRPIEQCFSYTSRKIEAGSRAIANELNGTRLWLQLPRGNFEIIHPRPILIERLKVFLDAKEWRKAFIEMRRHRINLDLIYTHNPKVFNDNIDKFVNEIDDADSLSLFVTSLWENLEELNIAKNTGRQNPSRNKINAICERIRSHLLGIKEVERFKRLYPVVLSCYISEKPERISAALVNMWAQLKKLKDNGQIDENGHTQLAQRWIKHITYLASGDQLLKKALKTYDLDIVMMVVQSTNLDPKEFMPVLNDLKKKTPPLYQKFHIDLYLEDWQSALEHIASFVQQSDLSEVELAPYMLECMALIVGNDLYTSALKLFCGRPHYKRICEFTANKFSSKRPKEAAILYERANKWEEAMECHWAVANFRDYSRLAKKIAQSAEKTEAALKKMVLQLMHKKMYSEAAELFCILGTEANCDKILECYERSNAWKKLCEFVSENEAIIQDIVNQVQIIFSTRCAQITEQIDSWKDLIAKHLKRLAHLREEKKSRIKQIVDEQLDPEDDLAETLSESSSTASSGGSISSNYSRMSTSRKKPGKVERKKQQIREGSAWEDGALLVALKEIYSRIDSELDELAELLPALLSMDLVERAIRLQDEMTSFLEFAERSHKQIWPQNLEAQHFSGPIIDLYRDEDNVVRIPTSGSSTMPARIRMYDELIPPNVRWSGKAWKLQIFQ